MTSKLPPGPGPVSPEAKPSPLLDFVDALLDTGAVETAPGIVRQRAFLEFIVGAGPYFLPLLDCREITRVPEIARVPEGPESVRGIVSVRGKILPVLDMRVCLGLAPAAPSSKSRLILVEAQKRILALLVDRVAGIARVDEPEIAPPGEGEPPSVVGRVSLAGRSGPVLSLANLLSVQVGARPGQEG